MNVIDKPSEKWSIHNSYRDNLLILRDKISQGNLPKIGVIGDIHGRADALTEYINDFIEQSVDTIIILGDLFDRGEQNNRVFRIVKDLKNGKYPRAENIDVIITIGNHDLLFLCYMLGDLGSYNVWIEQGGDKLLENFGISDLNQPEITRANRDLIDIANWMRSNMKLYYIDPDHGILFIHGGIPMKNNAEIDLKYENLNKNTFFGIYALVEMEHDLLLEFCDDNPNLNAPVFKSLCNTHSSPLWVRENWFGIFKSDAQQDIVDTLCEKLAINGIVYGHTHRVPADLKHVQLKIHAIDFKLTWSEKLGGILLIGQEISCKYKKCDNPPLTQGQKKIINNVSVENEHIASRSERILDINRRIRKINS